MLSILVARRPARLRRALAIGAALAALSAPSIGAAQSLSLSDALSRVASGDPSVAANAARLRAADAAITQADVRPRDVVGVDVEDFAGTGPYSPLERSQTTAWYERTWERGGKREARIGAARSDLGIAVERNRLRMLDLLAQVQAAWVDALAAEAVISIAEQRLAAAQRVEAETGRRVGRALDPLFAGERARTAVAQARIALDQARRLRGSPAPVSLPSGAARPITVSIPRRSGSLPPARRRPRTVPTSPCSPPSATLPVPACGLRRPAMPATRPRGLAFAISGKAMTWRL
jgi:cobalt-zinc-cadmium efflux system outer membrane protein